MSRHRPFVLFALAAFSSPAVTGAGWPFCARPQPPCEPAYTCPPTCPECCPPEKKKRTRTCCLCPPAPPRGDVSIAIPARINRESLLREPDADKPEGGTRAEAERFEALQKDVTRLTIVVEELAKSQKQQHEDLTRQNAILEQITTKPGT